MIPVFFIFFVAELILFEATTATSGEDTNRSWIAPSYNKNKLEHCDNVLNCRDDEFCYALWQDGDGVNSGEHYWKVDFEGGGRLYDLQLGNKIIFERNFGYGESRNQSVEPGDTAGILASFSNGEMKGYFSYNNEPLREIFTLNTTFYKDIYPMISFKGPGNIKITKETEIPSEASRLQLKNIPGIEGCWTAYPENIKIKGVPLNEHFRETFGPLVHKNVATLVIRSNSIGVYDAISEVVQDIWFTIKTYDGFWRSNSRSTILDRTQPAYTDYILASLLADLDRFPSSIRNSTEELFQKQEQLMLDDLKFPDSVDIVSDNLILKQKDTSISFQPCQSKN